MAMRDLLKRIDVFQVVIFTLSQSQESLVNKKVGLGSIISSLLDRS